MSDSQYQWRACLLGAINGLLVGGIAYAILLLNVRYENQDLREQQLSGGDIMHVSVGIKWWGLPVIGLIVFTVGSLLSHKYLADRVRSIIWLWQYIGAVSVIGGILFFVITASIDHQSGARPIDFAEWKSALLHLLLGSLIAFAFVAIINLAYGAFIQMLGTQYARRRKTGFPG